MKILYFTATGNSLAVAKVFGGELKSIPQLVRDGIKEIEDDIIGIVSPTYLADAPKMVASFLKNTSLKADYMFGVFTYGIEAGGIVNHVQSYASQGGNSFDYLNTILMVDNAIERFEIGKELKKLPEKNVDGQLKRILSDVQSRKKAISKVGVKSKIADATYHAVGKYSIAPDRAKSFIINDSCVKCGICAKVCPANNIIVEDDVVKFLEQCEGCLGCLHNCPKVAIHLRRERSAVRFRNENVSLKEIISSNE